MTSTNGTNRAGEAGGGQGNRQRGQGRRGFGGGGFGGGPRRGPQRVHTVYILKADPDGKNSHPVPVQIHTGVTDNIYTEVLDGLQEGDSVITSVVSDNQTAGGGGGGNPFGGNRFRGR